MNIIVHQSIIIHNLRVQGISNSSVLQIGSAGIIKAESNLYNTGGFREPARVPGQPPISPPFVPLQPPT